ncbi:MAG: hypothetical protein EPN62_05690 [Candidimonas sp.]|nr:MAG: hypothetical protein EPN77_16745 [Candidimonas sp.]TAM24799.1 MAG: hypothetical protein EPN62_05690 [Candidimonas sp.]
MKYQDAEYVVSRPDGYNIWNHGGSLSGAVRTPHGFVKVYSEGGRSNIELIIDGVCYTRFFERGFTARGLVTKAARFAEDMHWKTL